MHSLHRPRRQLRQAAPPCELVPLAIQEKQPSQQGAERLAFAPSCSGAASKSKTWGCLRSTPRATATRSIAATASRSHPQRGLADRHRSTSLSRMTCFHGSDRTANSPAVPIELTLQWHLGLPRSGIQLPRLRLWRAPPASLHKSASDPTAGPLVPLAVTRSTICQGLYL